MMIHRQANMRSDFICIVCSLDENIEVKCFAWKKKKKMQPSKMLAIILHIVGDEVMFRETE